MSDFLQHYREIFLDPAHLAAEVTFMVLIDVLFLGLIWPFVRRAIHREHKIIDAEHGYQHDDPIPYVLTIKGWRA